MSTSTSYHHGNLRPALLAAAGEILEEDGTDGLSLRAVARHAGVSHNAPYRHFSNRAALLAALAAEGFATLADRLEGSGGGPEAGVCYVRFALENPQRFRLMFGGVVPFDAHPALREQADRAFEHLQRAVAQTEPAGSGPASAAAAWSLVHGLSQLLLDGHLRRAAGADPAAFAREVIDAARLMERSPNRDK